MSQKSASKKTIASRYFHTLRHLKPIQFYGRLGQKLSQVRIDTTVAPGVEAFEGEWIQPAQQTSSLQSLSNHVFSFRFLNQVYSVCDAKDWNAAKVDKLWLYNLHYFDDLNSENHHERNEAHKELVERWIKENPAPLGNGWEPYPSSLRIVNWIKWFLSGQQPEPAWLDSLALQVRVLMQRLEHHLLGNHLFANAKALVFAGLYFKAQEADTWLRTGLKILEREVPEQVLTDGGNFELTPMYHSIMLMDLLDLINIVRAYQKPEVNKLATDWGNTAEKMVGWLQAMCHPDGEISLFNDAAMGVAPPPVKLFQYAESLSVVCNRCPLSVVRDPKEQEGTTEQRTTDYGLRTTFLKDSGFVRLANGKAVTLLDVAKVGPDYIPGHAHADSLSFELSVFGQRLLVNSGTSCYGISDERLRQRGTAAHNTVVINGENSSEVWSGFRVARRAYPKGLKVDTGSHTVSCSHTGYRWLKGKPEHQRKWVLSDDRLVVSDSITGSFDKAQARYHLHPEVKTENTHEGIKLRLPEGQEVLVLVSEGQARLEQSTWHPEFGRSEPNQCLVIHFTTSHCSVTFQF